MGGGVWDLFVVSHQTDKKKKKSKHTNKQTNFLDFQEKYLRFRC